MAEYNDNERKNEESMLNKYTMMQHLSSKEKKNFEDKFTVPKNGSQKGYHNMLNQKSKKLLLQQDQPELEKHCLLQKLGLKIFC